MSPRKKVALAAGAVLGAALLALLVLPLFFVDRIEARVRTEAERVTRLALSWDDIGLDFFRSFPNPTFSLTGLTAVGTGSFENDTLAAVGSLRMALEGRSAIAALRGTGPLVVRSVRVDEPRLRLRVDESGLSSWDLGPEGDEEASEPSEEGRALSLSLRRFELTGGDIVYDNAQSGAFVSVQNLSHTLRGDFSRSSLTAETAARADAVTARFAGTSYLAGVALDVQAGLEVDTEARRVRLVENELRLNDLVLRLDGTVTAPGETVTVDLAFEAPSTEFGQLLSLLPTMYAEDFATVETSGTFALTGEVRGDYGPNVVPSFSLDVDVRDGSFRDPALGQAARAIAADLTIVNPGGDLDDTVIELSRFHMEVDGQPIDATLALRTPLSDPDVDVTVSGTLDVGAAARALRLANAEELGGVVEADARARLRRSDVEEERYDRIAAEGTVSARNLTLRGDALRQPVDVEEATLHLTPRAAELRAFRARLGSSDVEATGRLDNLLGFALGQETLQGTARFASQRFVLDEWRSEDELAAIAVPGMLDVTVDGTVDELVFNGLTFTDARGRAIVRDQRATLENVALSGLGGRIGMEGFYETVTDSAPTFSLDLVLDSLDVASSAELVTVRALAPIAPYARGSYSSALNLSGTLGEDMAPVLEVLDGEGSFATSNLAVEGFPMLVRLAETLQFQALSNPTVGTVRSTLRIEDGRLVVQPFDVGVAGASMTVSGSNGIDRSLDYTLGLRIPRAGLAEAALTSLASRAGPLGATLAAADPVRVGVRVTGTVTDPDLGVTLSETTDAARTAAAEAAEAAVQRRIDDAQARLDAEQEEARRRAQARADSIVAEAERRAETIRSEAASAAERVRAEGNRAADELLARATNPIARAAAQPAADRLRREADERATALEREADERATALVSEARARAAALVGGGGG